MLACAVLGDATSTVTGVPHMCSVNRGSEMELMTVKS
jgi:hypothetical protein